MKKLRFTGIDDNRFILDTGGKNPAICYIWDIKVPDGNTVITCEIDWVIKGAFTNRHLKKMLQRTFNSMLRRELRRLAKIDK